MGIAALKIKLESVVCYCFQVQRILFALEVIFLMATIGTIDIIAFSLSHVAHILTGTYVFDNHS